MARIKDVKARPPGERGRPGALEPWMLERSYSLALTGYTNEEMAGIFGVSTTTFHRWMEQRTDFRDSLRAGREFAVADVVKSMHERAQGYSKTLEKRTYDGIGNLMKVEAQDVFIPPDAGAQKFIVQVRSKAKWNLNAEAADEDDIELENDLDKQ